MSYILDALKKSEAERSRGAAPTLLSPQQTSLRSGIVGWVIGAALILNAGLLFAWFYWPHAPIATTTATASTTQSPPSTNGGVANPQVRTTASIANEPVAPRPNVAPENDSVVPPTVDRITTPQSEVSQGSAAPRYAF